MLNYCKHYIAQFQQQSIGDIMKKHFRPKKEPLIEKIYSISKSSENELYRRDCTKMIEFYINHLGAITPIKQDD